MYIVHKHVCVFTWEGEAEKESQEEVWPGGGEEVGRVEPSDGQGQVGRDEGVSQFGGEMAWYGAAGEADRPQP